ncbi:MAG TPA: 23S rRNA (guanosine(2251)-2'-O)-methyltransferase RlmB [Lachnospiraceae bacterium]|nr:23S rRNA (guanosine(2251)-2'-O)-methyltransferase RlmB [Lachnospiraceae bacterium]
MIRKNNKKDTRGKRKENGLKPAKFEKRKPEDHNIEQGLQLEGRNAVLEALNHDKPIDKLFIKKGEIEGTLRVIVAKARDKGIVVQEISKDKMAALSKSNNNQGVVAMCPAHDYSTVEDIIASAREKGEDPFIIICDEINDPHNLGAIIRTAEACGAHGVIISKRRAVGLSAIVSKTSAGAIEFVPVARVSNISATIDKLKKENIWVACADMDGKPYFNENLKGAVALVVGNEGEGVGKLVKEKCDFTVGIPMYGNISSLNASVSAGLIMYEIVRQRKF